MKVSCKDKEEKLPIYRHNDPLMSIIGNVELARRYLNRPEHMKRCLNRINEAARKISAINMDLQKLYQEDCINN